MNELFIIIGYIGAGLITWGAIRSDIKNMHKDIEEAKTIATTAHARIDSILIRNVK